MGVAREDATLLDLQRKVVYVEQEDDGLGPSLHHARKIACGSAFASQRCYNDSMPTLVPAVLGDPPPPSEAGSPSTRSNWSNLVTVRRSLHSCRWACVTNDLTKGQLLTSGNPQTIKLMPLPLYPFVAILTTPSTDVIVF